MRLPPDFDRDLWLCPLTFQGLVGNALCYGYYKDLFREDQFAKPISDLMNVPKARKYLERECITPPEQPTPFQSAHRPIV
jgi:hypothetical protein